MADNDNGGVPTKLQGAVAIQRMYRLMMGQLDALATDADRLAVIAMMAAGASLFATGDKGKASDFLEQSFLPNAQNMLDAAEADYRAALNALKARTGQRPNRFIPTKKD